MLGAQALGLPHPSPRLRSPCWNWQAVTLGGDPSRFSGQKVLCRAVQARAGLRDREHEVSGQKFAGLAGSCRLVPHAARPGSRDGPTRPARLARGALCWRVSLSAAPDRWHSESRPVHSTARGERPSGRGRGRRPVTAAPGPRPVLQPRRRPRAPAPLPARLGGGAHSSSSSSNSGGDADSSGAPGRSGLRAFQRVWTSMPAGRGAGRAGTLGDAGLGPGSGLGGAGTTSGRHGEQARLVPFVAAAPRHGSARALAHGRDGSTLARGAAGTPLGSLALASSNSSDSCSPPLAAAAPRPAPRARSARVRS